MSDRQSFSNAGAVWGELEASEGKKESGDNDNQTSLMSLQFMALAMPTAEKEQFKRFAFISGAFGTSDCQNAEVQN